MIELSRAPGANSAGNISFSWHTHLTIVAPHGYIYTYIYFCECVCVLGEMKNEIKVFKAPHSLTLKAGCDNAYPFRSALWRCHWISAWSLLFMCYACVCVYTCRYTRIVNETAASSDPSQKAVHVEMCAQWNLFNYFCWRSLRLSCGCFAPNSLLYSFPLYLTPCVYMATREQFRRDVMRAFC